jgi:hypothetical protein
MDDQTNPSTDEELKSIKARLEALEDTVASRNQGTSGGVPYSYLRSQLDEVSLRVEALHDTLVQVLQKQSPEFQEKYKEVYNDLQKKHEKSDEADYLHW